MEKKAITQQIKAYENRERIQVGDAFVWHCYDGYGTSGDLPEHYIRTSYGYEGDMVLRICHVCEGRNGYGPFVDYYLNLTGVYDRVPAHCLIINGPDAFKMERARTPDPLILIHKGRDGWDRPVYEDKDGRLWVDVDPMADRQPKLCTVLDNIFGGEPDTPMEVMKRYKGVPVVFEPERDTWKRRT